MANSYYGQQAYQSNKIPLQPKPKSKSALKRFATIPLPWGNADPVAPATLFDNLSAQAQNERDPREETDSTIANAKDFTGNSVSHERICYAPLARRTLLVAYGYAISKFWTTWGGGFLLICTFMVWYAVGEFYIKEAAFIYFCFWIPGPTLWLLFFLITFLPHKLWFRAGSKGMLWELNRRTGMVSLRKNKFTAPFYEFDPFLVSTPGRAGVIFHQLYLEHRYQNYYLDLSILAPVSNQKEDAYALWDFLQNYMDISQPLPDIPVFEIVRSHDPVTASYDKATHRNPRYWRDMDEATWKQKCQDMSFSIARLNTRSRSNIMDHFTIQ